jgi:hypothetical protein
VTFGFLVKNWFRLKDQNILKFIFVLNGSIGRMDSKMYVDSIGRTNEESTQGWRSAFMRKIHGSD